MSPEIHSSCWKYSIWRDCQTLSDFIYLHYAAGYITNPCVLHLCCFGQSDYYVHFSICLRRHLNALSCSGPIATLILLCFVADGRSVTQSPLVISWHRYLTVVSLSSVVSLWKSHCRKMRCFSCLFVTIMARATSSLPPWMFAVDRVSWLLPAPKLQK